MTRSFKKIRFYWWLLVAFVKKNLRVLLFSFIGTLLGIIVMLNIYPSFQVFFLRNHEIIGVIGRYSINSIPQEIVTQISSPLINVNSSGEIIPVLAENWEVLDKNKTYRFYLKKNLFWDDHTPFLATDISYDFKDDIKINIIDDTTIEFSLSQPLSIFPIYLTKPIIKEKTHGVASPYKIQNYKIFKGKFSEINLFPLLEGLPYKTYKYYFSEEELLMAYKKGEINQFITPKKYIADQLHSWKNTTIDKTIDYQRVMTLFFNMKSKQFEDREMRKSIVLATNRMNDLGVSAISPISPSSWAYYSDVKQYPFDKVEAKKIIDDNYVATTTPKIKLYTFYDYADIAEQYKNDYQSIGYSVELKLLSDVPDDFDILLTMWDLPLDPDQYIYWHSTQIENKSNITNYVNLKVDKLLEEGRSFSNIQQRKKIYRDFQKTIADDIPAFFIYHPYVYKINRK